MLFGLKRTQNAFKFLSMNRTVRTDLFKSWMNMHDPNPLGTLALASDVSVWTLAKVRGGKAPRKAVTRRLIAKAMGLTEDELFPKSKVTAS